MDAFFGPPHLTSVIATQEILLADGLRVRAPDGKCIDTGRTRQEDGRATVVMANCSNVGGNANVGLPEPGLIFLTVVPGSHGEPLALGRRFADAPGLIARSGQDADVTLISLDASDVALYVNLIDRSPGGPRGVSAQHWKATLDLAGRAIVISVFGETNGPVPEAGGEALARAVAQSMIDNNGQTAPLIAGAPILQAPPGPEVGETATGFDFGVLRGLFDRS
ncbi:MAG: hypothetical protein AAF092_17670 [Pseudomonadota bacterium]